MRLPLYVLVVLLAAAPAWAAQPASHPPRQQATFSVGTPLPKWVQPFAEPAPTTRREPAVYRLLETQAWAGPHPGYVQSRALQVNDQSALGQIGEFGISYYPAYQTLSLNRVVILRGDRVLDRTRTVNTRVLQREQNLENGVYGGASTVQLLLEDVRVGDTLWVTYTVEGANPVFGQRWADEFGLDSTLPTELRRLTVSHPRQRPLFWRQLGDLPAAQVKPAIEQAGEVERLRFEERNIEAVLLEPSIPSDFLPHRIVQMSEYADWQAVATWAAGLFPRAAPSPALQQLAHQFAGEATPAAQAAAALHWVQDEIRYFSVAIGENSHRPQAPETVIKRRYGDCKDKSYLLVSLLGQLGIKAQPVLINAQAQKLPGKLIASPSWFDHVIVRIEIDGKEYYVDPTNNGQKGPLAQLPTPFPGGLGLLVDPSTRALTALPERPESYLPFERIESFAIADFDGDATLETRDIYRGAYADWARSRFPVMSAGERNKQVLGEYEKRYPGVSLLEPLRIDDHPEAGRFELVTRLNLRKPVKYHDKQHDIEYGSQVLEGTLGLPDTLVRTFPFALPLGKYHARYRLNITWPAVVRDDSVPLAKTIDNQFFRLVEEYTYRGNHLSYMLDYRLKSDRVAAADLSPLQQASKQLYDFVSGSFRAGDDALVQPEGMGYSYRNLDSARAAWHALEWGKANFKRKPEEIDTGELCAAVESTARLRDLVAGTAAEEGFNILRSGLEHDARPGAARCLGGLLYAEGKFDGAIRLLAADKTLKDDDPLVARLAWARAYAGDARGAAADMARFVAARERAGVLTGLDRGEQIALLRKLGQPVPPELLAWAAEVPDGPWPRPLLAMQAGLLEPQAVLGIASALPADARDLALNDAWIRIGQRRLADHDLAGAAEAFHWYAANGVRGSEPYLQAQFELAQLATTDADYLAGVQAARRGDHAAAFALWTKSAQRGVAPAQREVGNAYYEGKGVQRDYGAALRWMRLAADQHYAMALNDIGYMYANGQGVARDEAAAVAWYRRAAAAGFAMASYNLGDAYKKGRGVPVDRGQALAWFRQAAELNDDDAQAELAYAYRTGDGIARDYVQAAFWARQSSLRNNDYGRIELARLMWHGNGMEADPVAGTAMMRLAAEHGSARAQYLVGLACEEGRGVATDLAGAARWYEKAAHQGDTDGMWALGLAYRDGQGVARDLGAARQWLEKAAAGGHAPAQVSLGNMYQSGNGVARDAQRALAYYRAAAEAGDEYGQTALALALQGSGTAAGMAEAVEWYRKAAAQGHALAQNNLADMYENGFGVPRDYGQAISLYRQAALTGFPTALYSLGTLYERGMGFPQDPRLAYVYYQIAGRLYTSDERRRKAADRRDAMAKALAPAELAQADALAAAWKVSLPLPGAAAP